MVVMLTRTGGDNVVGGVAGTVYLFTIASGCSYAGLKLTVNSSDCFVDLDHLY